MLALRLLPLTVLVLFVTWTRIKRIRPVNQEKSENSQKNHRTVLELFCQPKFIRLLQLQPSATRFRGCIIWTLVTPIITEICMRFLVARVKTRQQAVPFTRSWKKRFRATATRQQHSAPGVNYLTARSNCRMCVELRTYFKKNFWNLKKNSLFTSTQLWRLFVTDSTLQTLPEHCQKNSRRLRFSSSLTKIFWAHLWLI